MNKNIDKEHDNLIKKSISVLNTNFKIVIIVLVIWAIFSLFTKGIFLSPRNLSTLFRQATILGIMSIGLMMVLTTGNIDMSIGAVTGYTSILASSLSAVFYNYLPDWYPALNKYISIFGIETTINGLLSTLISLIFCILFGIVFGFFQGSLIAYFGIPSLIATLGTSFILVGLIRFAVIGGVQAIDEKSFLYLGQGYASKEFGIFIAIIFTFVIFSFTLWSRKQKKIYYIKQPPLYIDLLKTFLISILVIGYIFYVANGYMGFQIPVLIMIIIALIFSYILSRNIKKKKDVQKYDV